MVSLTFDTPVGYEQSGRRPALVLSPAAYNAKVGLFLACPITRQIKGYPFEVVLPPGTGIEGAILADQVKSLDWRSRQAELLPKLAPVVVDEVLGKLAPLV